jgi:hypothetical protein
MRIAPEAGSAFGLRHVLEVSPDDPGTPFQSHASDQGGTMKTLGTASLFSAALLAIVVAAPLPAQTPPATEEKDCLTENANMKNKMQFFVCLNAKREYCQDQLLKLQTECQPSSVKYSGAYSRYLVVKNKSNQLIDMLIAELKYSDKTPPEKFKQLMQEINTSSQEFEKYVMGTTCEGASNRFILPLLLPVITAAFLDRSRSLMDGWLSGNKNAKEQRAAELSTQRWRSPLEFGASAPLAAPQPPPQAPPPPDPAATTAPPPPKPPGGF